MNIIDILRQQSQFLHVYGKRWWTMAKLSFPIMIFQITNSLKNGSTTRDTWNTLPAIMSPSCSISMVMFPWAI